MLVADDGDGFVGDTFSNLVHQNPFSLIICVGHQNSKDVTRLNFVTNYESPTS